MSVETNPHNYTNMNLIFSQFVAAKNSVRPRKGMAEGCGGNSAMPLQKIEASPAALLVKAKHHRKILFSLREEKIRRAQNEKSKEYFYVVRRALASGGGAASFVRGFPKMGSDFVQGVEPDRMIRVLRLGASPLGGQIGKNFPRLFEFKANRLRAQNVVRRAPACRSLGAGRKRGVKEGVGKQSD